MRSRRSVTVRTPRSADRGTIKLPAVRHLFCRCVRHCHVAAKRTTWAQQRSLLGKRRCCQNDLLGGAVAMELICNDHARLAPITRNSFRKNRTATITLVLKPQAFAEPVEFWRRNRTGSRASNACCSRFFASSLTRLLARSARMALLERRCVSALVHLDVLSRATWTMA